MLTRVMAAAAVAALATACPSPQPARPGPAGEHAHPPPSVPAEPPPAGRLGDQVTPVAYRLSLELEPGRPRYRGAVEIDIAMSEPRSSVWLHGTGLTVESARLRHAGGELALQRLAAPVDRELIGFGFGTTVAAGNATLVIEFAGEMRTTDGIFHQRHVGAWYAYTDFEPIDARRGLPCFDDPRWRTPWTLTLTVPRGLRAVSNTPVEASEDVGTDRSRVRFATTPPLPSYLLAFAVGPFEAVEGPADDPMPVRVLTFPGRTERARRALDAARALLPIARQWVDLPLPWRKLDFVAVPIFDGAMENPGLITVSDRILHVDADDPEPSAERLMVLVIAHELAHLWFGDQLNMRWWDDLWLNEGFASYLADEWIEAWKPDWHWQLERESLRARAYDADSRADARAVRQPVASRAEIKAAFDVITYIKGGAILEMIERALGEDVFRARVRAYARAHLGGTVTTEDLERALGSAAGEIIASYVDRPGVPIVPGARACDLSKQAAYRLVGEPATTASKWLVPCVDVGYFLRRPDKPASEREAMQKLEWVRAEVRRGAMSATAAAGELDVGPVRGTALERQLEILDELDSIAGPAPPGRTAGAAITAAAMAAIGWDRVAGERADDREVRARVIRSFARYHPVPARIRARAERWLRDRRGLDDELAGAVLAAVATRGDAALHTRVLAELERENDGDRRDAILTALAAFARPAVLDRTLALTLDPKRSRIDAIKLLYQALDNPLTRARAYRFLASSGAQLGRMYRTNPLLARFACAPDEIATARALVGEFTASSADETRMLDQVRDEFQTCERLRRIATEAPGN